MNQELIYYTFIAIYILISLHVLYQDLISKYILVWSFYIFIIMSTIYYYITFDSIIWVTIMSLYILTIFILDIIEYFKWPIEAIWENWMFMWSGIYDYFLYIYIWALTLSDIIINIWALTPFINFFINILATITIWLLLLKYHNSKVALLVKNKNLKTYEEIMQNLYNWELAKLSFLDLIKNKTNIDTDTDLMYEYKKRWPLYVFWSIFIISSITLNIISWII